MNRPGHIIPFSFDLSSLVRHSVASLYSHLITRPTGRALRLGIESQIGEIGSVCVSVLDFTQVVVLDYSCADEAVAKLIQRYQAVDRPADAYFVARGLREQHRDPIEAVLHRHQLALVAEVDNEYTLLGDADTHEFQVWELLQRTRRATRDDIAGVLDIPDSQVSAALEKLTSSRVVLRSEQPVSYFALTTLLP